MTSSGRKPMTIKGVLSLVAAGLLVLVAEFAGVDITGLLGEQGAQQPGGAAASSSTRDDTALIRQLFEAGRSNEQVEAEGTVVHLLPDDNEGSRHQLFLCELSNDMTLKISHNIDIAPYIDGLAKGDRVRFHGEYEWNDKGGVVHWTHRNTRGGPHPGGWILHEGRRYE